MIKKTIYVSSLFCFATLTPLQLKNPILLHADKAGVFDGGIIDILAIRSEIKNLVLGKHAIKGQLFTTPVYNQDDKAVAQCTILVTQPALLCGATYLVVNPNHPQITELMTAQTKDLATEYIKNNVTRSTFDRINNPNTNFVATGLYIINPITKEKLPLIISDYALDAHDTRAVHIHVAVPAHNNKDFNFAQTHNLPIKLVGWHNHKSSSSTTYPEKLTHAHVANYNDYTIINSAFLNGNVKQAHDKAVTILQNDLKSKEYKNPILYTFAGETCCISNLQAIEKLLTQENKKLTEWQQAELNGLLLLAKLDFLTIVEQFLNNIHDSKDLVTQLIEESCQLRNNPDAFLLAWVRLKTDESEKSIFNRDINSFYKLCRFCSELIDFLEDFASSCPCALEKLKKLQNNR